MNRERLKNLYEKYKNRSLSPEEKLEWDILVRDPHLEDELSKILEDEWWDYRKEELEVLDIARADSIFSSIIQKPTQRHSKRLWPWIAAAASIVIAFFVIGQFYKSTDLNNETLAKIDDIAPGKVGATLTLANGKKIRLSSAANGQIANEAGITVTKTADGQLIYEIQKGTTDGEHRLNTLTTEKGESYRVRLQDGTIIWLNAASKLTYPENLSGVSIREVHLSGEGYFQVAKDKLHPFVVTTNNQRIQVLGTAFNVSAYEDDQITKTTLEEGSVKVNVGKNEQTLIPGQQAISKDNKIKIQDGDLEEALAWKNGYFRFKEENITSIMTKLSRWYNVDIEYIGEPTKETFTGTVDKNKKISQVLQMLQSTNGVSFKIKERRISVLP
ncbi:MAG: FecR family protein [Pedobacter sp.]|nr:MAG: FecR family protein [Pedobacter sp.]